MESIAQPSFLSSANAYLLIPPHFWFHFYKHHTNVLNTSGKNKLTDEKVA